MPTAVGTRRRAPKPKSRPPVRNAVHAGWRHHDFRRARPKGLLSLSDRLRRLVWSWWPWALLSVWVVTDTPSDWLGVLFGAVAILAYLAAPAAEPPRYGLDHEMSVAAPGFRRTMAGASGSVFLDGNALEILNNGDAFYPAMLEAIQEAKASITIEAYIYWAGEIGHAFAEALAAQARAGLPVKILLDAIGSAQIGGDILEILERRRLSGRLVQPDSLVHARPVQQPDPSEVTDCGWPHRLHGWSGHRRSLARRRPQSERVARHSDSARRSGRRADCRLVLPTTGSRRPASW